MTKIPEKAIKRIVLDVLKPHEPELDILAKELLKRCEKSKDLSLNLTVYQVDQLTTQIKVIVEGESLDYDEIKDILSSLNCVTHSLDQVAAGKRIVEDIDTPLD